MKSKHARKKRVIMIQAVNSEHTVETFRILNTGMGPSSILVY